MSLLAIPKKHIKTIAALWLLAFAGPCWAADVDGVRLWRAPDHTRLVFDLSGPVEHSILSLNGPDRVVIDIPATRLKADFGSLNLDKTPVQRIRSGVRNGQDLRLVLDLGSQVRPRSFLLKSSGSQGDRLVIDLYDPDGATPVVVQELREGERDIVVAIDAGHGGEDPGASGPGKLREKDVVLAIARKLEKRLKAERGYRPVMLRNGDYYVGHSRRRELAHEHQADLFISIHADAFHDSRAYGSSVYALSQRGATSTSASYLADKENSSDLVGGVTLSDKDDVLAGVLFDLSMTATLGASMDVGNDILAEMGSISRLHKKKVEQANFAVLRSPDIPSILIETGFISNPKESNKLKTSKYQQAMATQMFEGLDSYFRSHPPAGSLIAKQQKNNPRPREYVIARGDTLSEIAERYSVSVASIRQVNGLASSRIKIGQKLNIPAS